MPDSSQARDENPGLHRVAHRLGKQRRAVIYAFDHPSSILTNSKTAKGLFARQAAQR
jgi:hypothetical protein